MQADRFPRALATALAALLLAIPLPVSASEAAASGGAEVEAEAEAAGGDETGVSDAALMALAREPFQGDLEGIVNRGFLRIGTVHSPILLSYDGAEQTGMAVDLAEELEKHLRQTIGKPAATLNVVLLPLTRDALIPALLDGRVDMLAANLTITPARAERIAFTDPMLTEVSEVVVTGPGLGPVADLEALLPQGVALRPTSSYASSLEALNAAREAEGKTLIPLKPLDERLEDHDAIELVIDGAAAATVVDSHKATLWAEVFPEAHVNEAVTLAEGQRIAWAVRPDAPELLKALNAFVKEAKKGTLLGNMIFKRYLEAPKRAARLAGSEDTALFGEVYPIIERIAEEYGFSPRLIAAQGFQESRLDQSKVSKAGAVGIMQVLPQTARDPNVGIPDISVAERNVEAGVKYLRFLRDRYVSEPDIDEQDRVFMAFGAYNAGPANLRKARQKTEELGLDPNVWFGNVEVGMAKAVSREPVIYVRNILKYFVEFEYFLAASDAEEATAAQ